MFLRVLDIRQGNQEAYCALYEMYHMKVFRFFLKRLENYEDSKDLTQDCFIRLWRFRHTLSEDHTLEKQLFIMAYQVYVNFLEKKVRTRNNRAAYLVDTSNSLSSSRYTDSIEFEKRNQIEKAIENLPPSRRKIMQLRLIYGYNNKEIAQHLQISVKTVENQITKSVDVLKNWLCRDVLVWLIIMLSASFVC